MSNIRDRHLPGLPDCKRTLKVNDLLTARVTTFCVAKARAFRQSCFPRIGGARDECGGGVLGVQQNGTIASTIVDNTGVVGFSKAGTGKVVFSGSNTYTGATTVNQGTLSINSVANGGQPSAIGAASADPSNLVIQGATLEYIPALPRPPTAA
jgi:autotransporter-associated beta strand protein